MARSKHLADLAGAVATLRQQFLPPKFDLLGVYQNDQLVRAYARAFVVLAHAEVESYLESWAKAIAQAAEKTWQGSSRVTTPLACLLATEAERLTVPHSLAGTNTKDVPTKLSEEVARVFERFYKRVKDNNGIKESNVNALFGPIGLPSSALGATLVPLLEYVGSLRGTHAHLAATAVVQSALDPETEFNRFSQLVSELEVLDGWLMAYKRTVR